MCSMHGVMCSMPVMYATQLTQLYGLCPQGMRHLHGLCPQGTRHLHGLCPQGMRHAYFRHMHVAYGHYGIMGIMGIMGMGLGTA